MGSRIPTRARLDDDRQEDWPAFFTEPCLYKITSSDNYRRGFPVGADIGRLERDYGFGLRAGSRSSDYHGTGKVGHALGVNTTDPAEFERLLALAQSAATAAGRDVPRLGVA